MMADSPKLTGNPLKKTKPKSTIWATFSPSRGKGDSKSLKTSLPRRFALHLCSIIALSKHCPPQGNVMENPFFLLLSFIIDPCFAFA
jgi:hypothetical protein